MAIDPQCLAVLKMMADMQMPDLSSLSVPAARALFESFPKPEVPTPVDIVQDENIAGPAGPIPIRIYRSRQCGRGTFIYLHGGGWTLGGLDTYDEICRKIAASGISVVSVGFRLAPEAPFPAPAEDCYAATLEVHARGPALGLDVSRLAIGGESSGANLALAVSQMIRDRGGPTLALQALICPVADSSFSTESYSTYAEGYFLTRSAMEWFWQNYAPTPAQRESPYAAPLRARDLSGLPSTFLITAELDPLRDEGEQLAARLTAAEVEVSAKRYEGVFHGFVGFSTLIDKANSALDELGTAVAAACEA